MTNYLPKQTEYYKTLDVESTLKELNSTKEGLSSGAIEERIKNYGYNEIKEKEVSPLRKFLLYFYGPMPIAIEAAAVVSAVIGHWDDFTLIVILLLTNVIVTFWQERSASNAIKQLMKKLALKSRVLRDGKWKTLDSRELVPGDVIRLRLGDVVPADGKLIEGNFLSIDQSSLTGESLPVEAHIGDIVYSASMIKQGEMSAVVVGTGENTYFGQTTHLVATASNITGLSKIISSIVYFLVGLAIVLGVLTFYFGISLGFPILSDLLFLLILLVASIPIALPVVLTVTMALGALSLAERKAIVTRLVAIEELASMDVLCSDKTGTLTKNSLTVGTLTPYGKYEQKDLLRYASYASRGDDMDAIDKAILEAAKDNDLSHFRVVDFLPFDPDRKRTEATIEIDGRTIKTTKGEPNTILSMCNSIPREEIDRDIVSFAEKGYRVIAVGEDTGVGWNFAGLIPLFDPLRDDSKETISSARDMGIDIKMITGDNEAIAEEIGTELGLKRNVMVAKELESNIKSGEGRSVDEVGIFARVYPEDKYLIVDRMEKEGHTVGMTGDGVNDAPALKKAQVGIAVEGATDAARAAADIVFTGAGISTIINAVQEGRRIFQRMQSYVLYRVIETLRILVFVTAAIVIWHFYPISAFLLIILALLNDLPIIAVSTDNVIFHKRPEKWNMRYIGGLSALLGNVGAAETLFLIYIAMDVFHLAIPEILSLVFLKLIVSGHLTMLVTRSRKAFWKIRPSKPLFAALISTMIVGYVMVVFGVGLSTIGNVVALFVVGYAFVWFLVEDGLRLLYDRMSERRKAGKSSGTKDIA